MTMNKKRKSNMLVHNTTVSTGFLNAYFHDVQLAKRRKSDNRFFNDKYIDVINKPFKAFVIKQLFKDVNYPKKIEKEVRMLTFTKKATDLFDLSQSLDFKSFDKGDFFYQLRNVFDSEVRGLVESIVKIKLDGELSIAASKYVKGDHLLCHDDKCGSRRVAFIYYVNQYWNEENGGIFEMLTHDNNANPVAVERKITPRCNTLLCFEVTSFSHHQVSEVIACHRARFAISGWFHSRSVPKLTKVTKGDNSGSELTTKVTKGCNTSSKSFSIMCSDMHDVSLCLHHNVSYYKRHTREMSDLFTRSNYIMLQKFFSDEFYNDLESELKSKKNLWIHVGQPNCKKVTCPKSYEGNPINQTNNALEAFLDLAQTTVFLEFLELISSKSFHGIYEPSLEVEINRWSHGNYTLVPTNESDKKNELSMELWFFFNVGNNVKQQLKSSHSGVLHYIFNDDKNLNNEDTIKIVPENNVLFLINRKCGALPFMKYLHSGFKNEFFHTICLRYSYKDFNDEFNNNST